jgi:predicted metalloprotease
MRMKWGILFLALAAALVVTGCGSKKKSSNNPTTTTSTSAKASKHFMAPAVKQPASATAKAKVQSLTALPKAKKAGAGGKAPQLKGLEGKSVEEKLTLFSQDIASFWQDGFTRANLKFTPATVYIITASQQVGCNPPGTVSADDKFGSFYCPTDSSLSLPVGTLTAIDSDERYGDAVVAANVAVGFGFHVLNNIGVYDTKATSSQRLLGATCLSGVWMSDVYRRGLLDQGDLEKIASGYPDANAQDQIQAFNTGYGGDPGGCLNYVRQ